MRPSLRPLPALVIFTLAALSATTAGCGGSFGRLTSAERLPADGRLGGPGPAALKVQTVTASEWASLSKQKVAPACDARGGAVRADKPSLDRATAAIGAWTEYIKKNPKPAPKQPTGPTVGDVIGLDRTDGSRTLTSLAFTCAGDKATIELSATTYTFDLAWVADITFLKSTGIGIQALSLKDKKVYYVSVLVPGDPKEKSDETAIIANIASYLPDGLEEPLVIAKPKSLDGRFETFVYGKGKTQGFYWLVPLKPDLSIERYLGVGAFTLGG